MHRATSLFNYLCPDTSLAHRTIRGINHGRQAFTGKAESHRLEDATPGEAEFSATGIGTTTERS